MAENNSHQVNLTPAEDAQLVANGFEPLPVIGKAVLIQGWQSGPIDVQRIVAMREACPQALSTGLRTRFLPAIDIDIVKIEDIKGISSLAQSLLGKTPLRRRGARGLMLCFRTETPVNKITINTQKQNPNGKGFQKVEILGHGQQFVAFGEHPDTGKPYQWVGKDFEETIQTPLNTSLESLPLVTPDKLRDCADKIAALLTELGYPEAKVLGTTNEERPAPSVSAGDPVAERVLRDALSYLDPNADRGPWRDTIAGIRAANISDDDALFIRRQLAHDFSEGKLDRQARYKDEPPVLYTGPEAVDQVFDTMPPKENGIGVGRVFGDAQKAGWQGNPFGDGKSASETFKDTLAGIRDEPKGKLLRSVSFATLMERTIKPIEEIIPGLIEKGIATMFAGPGGTHKSRLAQQIGLSIQAGVPIFGKITEPCTFVYLDYENGDAEITRRTHTMRSRLGLHPDTAGHYFDLKGGLLEADKGPLPANQLSPPLALIEETGVTCMPLYFELHEFLRSIPGHKFVVGDSCYNLLNFTGQTKINESSVKVALNLLDYLCQATDSTMIYLWHPSQAGMERGDASGWSVAWHNTPRARLSLSKADNTPDAFELKVEKRNNGPAGSIITLHWRDGILLPLSTIEMANQPAALFEACVTAALRAAESGSPIQRQREVVKWLIDDIERAAGFKPTQRQVKEELENAVGRQRLRYIKGHGKQQAGYFPMTTEPATLRLIGVDTAKQDQKRNGGQYGAESPYS